MEISFNSSFQTTLPRRNEGQQRLRSMNWNNYPNVLTFRGCLASSNVGTAIVVSETNAKPWPENDETNSCEGKTMSPYQYWPERRDEFVRGKDNESVPVLTRKTRRMRAKERRLVRDESETTTASRDASVSIVEIVGSDWKWIQRLTWEREKDCDGEKSKIQKKQ